MAGLIALAALVIWYGILAPQRPREQDGPAPRPGVADIGTPPRENKDAAAPPSATSGTPPNAVAAADPPRPATEKPADQPLQPSFDIVRVEPTGETVIAGRGAPGATIDMLRNGEAHERVVADASGLFALVPAPLPPGSSEIVLQSIAPDGTRSRSRDSVTVVVAADRKTRPLVALTSPDRPTVVLSGPDQTEVASAAPPAPVPPPASVPAAPVPAAPAAPALSESGIPQPATPPSAAAGNPTGVAVPPPPPAPRAEVRVASVETQGGGRLFVSGQGAPGATVRLYLNDSLIAPGAAGPDGRFSFSIERGVRPGDYAVRLDDVDPVSGEVKSRAEVEFTVPPLVVAERAVPPAAPAPPSPPAAAPQPVAPPPGVAAPSASSTPAPAPSASAAPTGPAPPAAAMPPAATVPAPAAPQAVADARPGGRPPSDAATIAPLSDVPTIIVPEINTAIVARGDNLWRISRRVYGQGIRYTVIYGANQPQIRNPSRIYPGQVFVLPAEQTRTP